jgi:hypothetical protein
MQAPIAARSANARKRNSARAPVDLKLCASMTRDGEKLKESGRPSLRMPVPVPVAASTSTSIRTSTDSVQVNRPRVSIGGDGDSNATRRERRRRRAARERRPKGILYVRIPSFSY